jgi:segregation and condensation protein A
VSEDVPFETPDDAERLMLVLDGFEGPLDMLLGLARDQKVDLARLSILDLADQYLAFVESARAVRLELAADYLVMAAWLAYLKSRLLLPEPDELEPSGEELAASLAFQLQRLEAIQGVAERLMARPCLGRDVFARGAPEAIAIDRTSVFQVTLYDLLKAYGDHKRRTDGAVLRIEAERLYSIEDALERLSGLIGAMPEWSVLAAFLPEGPKGSLHARSALAAHFAASLELVKAGRVELRQDEPFAPLWLRRTRRNDDA